MSKPDTPDSAINKEFHALRLQMQARKRHIGTDIRFERTRRITGYLVGTLERFNNAKRAEERDRIRHGVKGA